MNLRNDANVLYCKVLSTEGDYLQGITGFIHEQMIREYLCSIDQIDESNLHPDERAMAVSRVWEQMGDFEMLQGLHRDSIDYYRSAMLSCLDGRYYEHDQESLPSRWLMLRFAHLYDKVKTSVARSKEADRLILLDPMINEFYRNFSRDR